MVQSPFPSRAWGKLRRDDAGQLAAWHPLDHHSADVAAVFLALLEQPTILDRLQRLARQPLTHPALQARLALVAFLHDVGKCNRGFFNKWRTQPDLVAFPVAGHGNEAAALLTSEFHIQTLRALPLTELAAFGDAALLNLLHAAMSHHGRPLDPDLLTGRDDRVRHLWARQSDGYDPMTELATLGDRARTWFAEAFADGPRFPESPAFQHAFAGLLQLADWLGSHTGFFEYSDDPDSDRWPVARKAAADAVARIGLATEPTRRTFAGWTRDFEACFGLPPRPAQAAISAGKFGQVVVIEAETGSGKTEAALWHFHRLFRAGAVDSLYFALPTRVAASQIHGRVLEARTRLFPGDPPLVVQAVPGYAQADGLSPAFLPNHEVLWPDHPDDQMAHRRWAAESAKRFLAAPIAVGTIDQALMATLQVRHAHLRLASLLRSLIVVDEVHASDAYMASLLRKLLRVHGDAGGHALLLSATLGGEARASLLGRSAPEPGEAEEAPYPALWHSGSAWPCVLDEARGERRVAISLEPILDTPASIAERARDAASEGARVLIVRNTVSGAVAVFEALLALVGHDDPILFRCNGVPTLHHGRFAREDRRLLDAAVQRAFGKSGTAEGMVVIGTQTLEQSLDLDADVLLTDLCPMDVLLQRLGRLHRHDTRLRPKGFEAPRARILIPRERDLSPLLHRPRHGLGSINGEGVYPNLAIIEATLRQLEAFPDLVLPRMNRRLVERSLHSVALGAVAALGQPWARHLEIQQGTLLAQRNASLHAALEVQADFPTQQFAAEEERISTRLGAASRLVVFDPPVHGPFGQPVRQIAVPSHWANEVAPDAMPGNIGAIEAGAFGFSLGGRLFAYGQTGLTRALAGLAPSE